MTIDERLIIQLEKLIQKERKKARYTYAKNIVWFTNCSMETVTALA